MKTPLKSPLKSKEYSFTIESKDMPGMELAFKKLTRAQKQAQTGTGYFFADGIRDHGFLVKSSFMMLRIRATYEKVMKNRKKAGITFYIHKEI